MEADVMETMSLVSRLRMWWTVGSQMVAEEVSLASTRTIACARQKTKQVHTHGR